MFLEEDTSDKSLYSLGVLAHGLNGTIVCFWFPLCWYLLVLGGSLVFFLHASLPFLVRILVGSLFYKAFSFSVQNMKVLCTWRPYLHAFLSNMWPININIFYWSLTSGFTTIYRSFFTWFLYGMNMAQGWEDFGSFYLYPKDKCTGNEVDYHDNPQRYFSFTPVNWFNTLCVLKR